LSEYGISYLQRIDEAKREEMIYYITNRLALLREPEIEKLEKVAKVQKNEKTATETVASGKQENYPRAKASAIE
jgi:hypothetical protein